MDEIDITTKSSQCKDWDFNLGPLNPKKFQANVYVKRHIIFTIHESDETDGSDLVTGN